MIFVFTPDTLEFSVILFYSDTLYSKVFLFDLNTKFQYSVTSLASDDDDVPSSKFEDKHDLRLNLRLSLRALGFCLLDPIVLI